jgi:hypothetical protein
MSGGKELKDKFFIEGRTSIEQTNMHTTQARKKKQK